MTDDPSLWPAAGEPARVGPDGLVRVHPTSELLTASEQAALSPERAKKLAVRRWMLATGVVAKWSQTPHLYTHPDYRPDHGGPPPRPGGEPPPHQDSGF